MKSYVCKKSALILLFVSILYTTTIAQSVSGIINSYYKVTGVNIVPNTLTVSSAAGLTPGLKILIIQMKGAVINSSNTSSFGDITSVGNAGNYEINYICGISGNNVLLQYQLLKTYDVSGSVQLIPVPQYNSVTITDTVKPAVWNAVTGTGGVVVLQASDTIFLNSPIDVSGKGFEGGALTNYTGCVWSTNVTSYTLSSLPADPNTNGAKKGEGVSDFIANGEYGRGKQANGGGGGNNHNTGGGGGSNYGNGGNGGNRSNETFFLCHGTNPGIGGLPLSSYGYTVPNNRIFMGGGGGSGHENNFVATPGGNGGGIILLLAKTIVSSGVKLLANGAVPYNALCTNPIYAEGDGGGGGGAGGTIILNVLSINGSIITEVSGANGSVSGNATNNCTGPGGGGGGGVLWVSTASVLPFIGVVTNGGANGTISMVNSTPACRGLANGATSGGNGTSLTGYVLPQATNFICAPLASTNLISFEGKSATAGNLVSWKVNEPEGLLYYQLERSVNQVVYDSITRIHNTNNKFNNYLDSGAAAGQSYYRLQLVYKNGNKEYSPVISLKRKVNSLFNWISLSPNPATTTVKMGLMIERAGLLQIALINQTGQQFLYSKQFIKKGYSSVLLPLASLQPGIYYLQIELHGNRQLKKLIIGK